MMNASRTQPATGAGLIKTVVAATFDALVIRGAGPIVVEFMSYGCGHCRTLEPVLVHVADTLADRERIMRVNVASEADLAAAYGVSVTPTLVMFLGGTEIERIEGPRPVFSSLLTPLTQPFAVPDARG
jgi:thioredoxin 1